MQKSEFDVIIVGAGAAGMMCAMSAGQRGKRVLLIEHAKEPGKKIIISGGGRCNFTNINAAPENFLSENRHFCKSALARYTQHDFIDLIKKHRIAFHEKTLGQLFCDGSARQVVQMLFEECHAVDVDLRLNCSVQGISKSDRYRVETNQGDFFSTTLVLASGGLSIPKMGATGFAHDIAQQFDLPLTEIRPALVPLTFSDADLDLMTPLSGLAFESEVTCRKGKFREALLMTHRGLSGPAILQISSYWREGDQININMLPGTDAQTHLLQRKTDRAKAETKTILSEVLPSRFAAALTEDLPKRPIGELSDKLLRDIGTRLNKWQVTPAGDEGYAKAEVTLGGVDTNALSSKTMEAKTVPGLFVIGEAVDVTGWLGGYNFQWAWSSGWAAGQSV